MQEITKASLTIMICIQRARLVGRNLEDLARINDLKLELHKKELKLEKLNEYATELKKVSPCLWHKTLRN